MSRASSVGIVNHAVAETQAHTQELARLEKQLADAKANSPKTVTIKIKNAVDVENVDGVMGLSDPYVVIHLIGPRDKPPPNKGYHGAHEAGQYNAKNVCRTTTVADNLNPVWNESFSIHRDDPMKDTLYLCVWDEDVHDWTHEKLNLLSSEKNNLIGQVKVPMKAALVKGKKDWSMPIIGSTGKGKGTLQFEISVKDDSTKVQLWEKEIKTAKAKHALSRERETKHALTIADMHMEDTAHQIKQHKEHTDHIKRELEHSTKTTKKTVHIKVKSAKGLMNVDGMMGASDPYCVVHILSQSEPAPENSGYHEANQPQHYNAPNVCRTETIQDNHDPVWNEKFEVERKFPNKAHDSLLF